MVCAHTPIQTWSMHVTETIPEEDEAQHQEQERSGGRVDCAAPKGDQGVACVWTNTSLQPLRVRLNFTFSTNTSSPAEFSVFSTNTNFLVSKTVSSSCHHLKSWRQSLLSSDCRHWSGCAYLRLLIYWWVCHLSVNFLVNFHFKIPHVPSLNTA